MRSDFRISIAAMTVLAAVAARAAARAEPMSPAAAPAPACAREASRGLPWPILPFGCATQANLRAMAADPADLERGRPLVSAQGDAALAPAERHRLGQVKPIGGETARAGAAPAGAAATGGQ